MKVGELKEALSKYSDDEEVLICCFEHRFVDGFEERQGSPVILAGEITMLLDWEAQTWSKSD